MVDLIWEANKFVTIGVKKTIRNKGKIQFKYLLDLIFLEKIQKIIDEVIKARELNTVIVSVLKYSFNRFTPTRKTPSPLIEN